MMAGIGRTPVGLKILLGLGILSAVACVPAYRPPRADQPHAVLKVRRVYEEHPGTNFREDVLLDGRRAFASGGRSIQAGAPRIDALLVHPEPVELAVEASFFHLELRLVSEIYYVQVPMTSMESYPCGGSHCSRMSTHFHEEMRTRWVHRWVEIVDGACSEYLEIAPAERDTLLVELTYRPGAVCELSCYQQVATGPQAFVNQRCRGVARPSDDGKH